jgi:hypothetical protein
LARTALLVDDDPIGSGSISAQARSWANSPLTKAHNIAEP